MVLTGAGRAFCAGGDVKAMQARSGAFAGSGVDIREQYRGLFQRIARAIFGLEGEQNADGVVPAFESF